MMKHFYILLLSILFVACNKDGGNKFGALDNNIDDGSTQNLDPISISSWTPETTVDAPLVMTNKSTAVFGVLVSGNVGTVNYDFIQNETDNLFTDSASAFKNIPGTSFASGNHQLKIVASNGQTSAEKQFYIRKNYSPGIFQSSNPSSNVIDCADIPIEFTATVSDTDVDDPKNITWELDSTEVISDGPDATPFTTLTEPVPDLIYKLIYSPDCTSAGPHTLKLKVSDGYDTTEASWNFTVNNPPPDPNVVDIISWIPTQSPEVVMTGTATTTFGVTVADGSGAITYRWMLDNDEGNATTGSTSFFSLNGADLSIGIHFLEVTASNGLTSDKKIFRIRKNTPPNIRNDFMPALSGNTLRCSDNLPMVIQANVDDANNDKVTVKWYLDESIVSGTTPFVAAAITGTAIDVDQATLTYNPDCSKVGFHTFKLVLNDGYEDYTQNWTVNVENPPAPPGDVIITNILPQESVVVVTGTTTTTFAVSVQDGAGSVKYKFFVDGNPTPVSDTSNAFLIKSGSDFTPGDHNIRVVAYSAINSTNNDERTFFVRRNKAPTIGQTPPSDYYSPSDEEVSAGADPAPSCGSTITFDAYIDDNDDDAENVVTSWQFDNSTVTTTSVNIDIDSIFGLSKRLSYTTSCSNTGPHQVTVRTYDGHETTEKSWLINVVNPAKESIGATTPSGSAVVVLSTDSSKTFTASAATGIAPFTFIWTKNGDVVKTEIGSSTTYEASLSDLSYGNQTIKVSLTDSSSANNPALPAERSWIVYKNKKPLITSDVLSSIKTNSNESVNLSASISDTSDETALQVSMARGVSPCPPPVSCGLTFNSIPTSPGNFSASFNSGTTYLGDNSFTLTVRDQHGETDTETFNIDSNLFSKKCNDLTEGQICTLSGMPGLGEDLDLTISANTVKPKIHPYLMTSHDVGLANRNFLYSDVALQVVWYWNRNSTDLNLGPITIKKNSVQAIIGNPNFPSTMPLTSLGNLTVKQLRNFHLYNPYGLTVVSSGSGSSMVTDLYIAEYSAARVLRLRFDNSNTSTVSVLRNRVRNASASGCNPYGVSMDTVSEPDILYVSCYNQHQVRRLSNPASSASFTKDNLETVFSDLTTVTSSSVDGAVPGTARIVRPTGVFFDNLNQLLYIVENGSPYNIRAYNPKASNTTLGSTLVEAGFIRTITGGLNAGTQVGAYNDNTLGARYGNAISAVPYWSGGALKGFFYADYSYHRIVFVNLSGSTMTLGNLSIANGQVGVVFGVPNIVGTSNNNGANGGGKKSTLNSPYGLLIDNETLYVADNGNNKIRSLVLNDPDGSGLVSTNLGLLPKSGFNESATLQADQVIYNRPRALKYDETNNRLLIADTSGYRIRALDLNTGIVDTVIGSGSGGLSNTQATPLQTTINNPRDIDILDNGGGEFLIYVDNTAHIKALNMFGQIETILGSDIDPGKTGIISGTNTTAAWTILNSNEPASIVPLRDPYGVGADPISGSVYHTDYSDHCIKKVDSSGLITQFAGLCGTFGNIPGTFTDTRLTYPGDIVMDPDNLGNFYFLDQTGYASSVLKYVNTGGSIVLFGSTRSANTVSHIGLVPNPNFASAVAVMSDKVCIANGAFTITNSETTVFNYANQSVNCYSKSGAECLFIGTKYFPDYTDATYFRGRMQKYDQEEGIGRGFNGDSRNIPVQLSGPQGLAFDDEGNLYISEFYGNTIRKVKAWSCN